ncbi:DUF2634 domain-containing protein [Viridibacillus arvi]|uniref:DUF2634 domain-containing protein n=1 Tax=Viridibacillus arvi TaxID=263475 RepID=UPI003D2C08AE
MIPEQEENLTEDIEFEDEPSKTYKLMTGRNRIVGYIDEIEALKQAIYLMLSIDRYDYLIYSWNYAFESKDLFGKPISYVISELKRRITEALTHDDRIDDVDAFIFEVNKNKVHTIFTVHSIYGEFESGIEVNI